MILPETLLTAHTPSLIFYLDHPLRAFLPPSLPRQVSQLNGRIRYSSGTQSRKQTSIDAHSLPLPSFAHDPASPFKRHPPLLVEESKYDLLRRDHRQVPVRSSVCGGDPLLHADSDVASRDRWSDEVHECELGFYLSDQPFLSCLCRRFDPVLSLIGRLLGLFSL